MMNGIWSKHHRLCNFQGPALGSYCISDMSNAFHSFYGTALTYAGIHGSVP